MVYLILGLLIVIFILIILCLSFYAHNKHTLEKLDNMIDCAIDGTFKSITYNETKMSKIESKMYRYLLSGLTSINQIDTEKNMIKTLISDISHQTKTPIANIILYIGLLSEEEKLSDKQKEIVCQIKSQSEKLNFLISSLVKISRLENGIVTINAKENNILDLFNSFSFESAARKKGVDLIINKEKDLVANFDLKWTSEAIGNIIDNAIKYTKCGGCVEVSACSYEFFVRIDVRDNGIGISEDDSAKIFERFYRAEDACCEEGVGIGLYLAREIVLKEGGYIKVSSKVGQGSTFSIFLSKL